MSLCTPQIFSNKKKMRYFAYNILKNCKALLTLLHSERLKLYAILAFLSGVGLTKKSIKQLGPELQESHTNTMLATRISE